MGTWEEEEKARDIADKRLLKWLRREVNRDLREYRNQRIALRLSHELQARLIADCKARLVTLSWADNWHEARLRNYGTPSVTAEMRRNSVLVLAGIRRLAQGYRDREGWRPEWDLP